MNKNVRMALFAIVPGALVFGGLYLAKPSAPPATQPATVSTASAGQEVPKTCDDVRRMLADTTHDPEHNAALQAARGRCHL